MYIRYVYGYLFFAIGILVVGFVAYLMFGAEYFSVQAEITSNWFTASLIFSVVSIPTYVLGVGCLLLGTKFTKINLAEPIVHLFTWAFVSGVVLTTIPVLEYVADSVFTILVSPLFMIWLPIGLTSLAYIAIRDNRVRHNKITKYVV